MGLSDRIRHLFAERPSAGAARSDWQGVYTSFAEVHASGPGFAGEQWVKDTRALTEQARTELASQPALAGDQALLPLVAGAAAAPGKPMRVLDFGGGLGIGYLQLAATLPDPARIEYHIVETERVCDEGVRLYAADPRVRFHRDVPPALRGVDVLYLNSALQYVEDWRGLLAGLCALEPRFVLLVRCSAGDTPTFATAQTTLQGSRIPYWFLNLDELVSLFAQSGYAPAFIARSAVEFRQDGLPERYRQRHPVNLLLSRR
jgi:putative methyltransferase (TIGR04325 family)